MRKKNDFPKEKNDFPKVMELIKTELKPFSL